MKRVELPPGPITLYSPARETAALWEAVQQARRDTEIPCRCGWDGNGEHLCHRCGKSPGKERFYEPHQRYALAGAMPKISVTKTWGCDTCWAEFGALRKDAP